MINMSNNAKVTNMADRDVTQRHFIRIIRFTRSRTVTEEPTETSKEIETVVDVDDQKLMK